jgi:TolA-binding protein
MRFTGYTTLATRLFCMGLCAMLLAPAPAPAASKETPMEELQRDVADLGEQLKEVQKALLDPKSGAIVNLQNQVQQALDVANKTNSSVNNLNVGMMQTMKASLQGVSDQLNSVIGLSAKVGGIADDVSNLQNSFRDLQSALNRQGQLLNDISNQVKLLQAPAVAPPGVDASTTPGASPPPPSAGTLFNNAVRDQNGGHPELALPEYTEFLRLYPNDPNAPKAQYYIGNIHYGQKKLADAVKDFDAITEQWPEDQTTIPDAMYMKGMALKEDKKPTAAIATFNDLRKKFPGSTQAAQASTQLRLLGATAATPGRKPAPSH